MAAIHTTLFNYTSGGTLQTVHTVPTTETHLVLYCNVTNLHASNDVRISIKHVRTSPAAVSTFQASNVLIPFGMSLNFPESGQKWTLEAGDSMEISTPAVGFDVDVTLSYVIL